MLPLNSRSETLVLTNSASPAYREGVERVLPWLAHLGLPGRVLNLACDPLPGNLETYSLLAIAHRQLDPRGTRLGASGRQRLLEAVRAGCGLSSFDPDLPSPKELDGPAGTPTIPAGMHEAGAIQLAARQHFILQGCRGIYAEAAIQVGEPLRFRPLRGPGAELVRAEGAWRGKSRAFGANTPGASLMAVASLGQGRVVRWATSEWMLARLVGPLGGLDRVFWRSLAWAARKPFVLRGLPPLITMRVDDVAGRGVLFEQSPLYWVQEANRWGFKPWLGLFIYNLTEDTVLELRDLLEGGRATAFPHAFGRPPRTLEMDFYYYENAVPWRAGEYDEFIYFDHQRKRPWPDAEASRGLGAVDEWYSAHAPLPISRYAIAHWGEMGNNTIAHVRNEWKAEFIGLYNDINQPLDQRTKWMVAGPFRRYEKPGSALFDKANGGARPMYYADFVNFAGSRFFTCGSEVRDETGYEWAPDNDVAKTAARGVRQLRRALDAMALPVLFTHETDYIYRIHPENWSATMQGVAQGIADVSPRFVTIDEGLRCVRATHTSRLASVGFDAEKGEVTACLEGEADVPTGFYLFASEGEEGRLVEVPAFEERVEVRVKI